MDVVQLRRLVTRLLDGKRTMRTPNVPTGVTISLHVPQTSKALKNISSKILWIHLDTEILSPFLALGAAALNRAPVPITMTRAGQLLKLCDRGRTSMVLS